MPLNFEKKTNAMGFRQKEIASSGPAAAFIFLVCQLYSSTFRITVENEKKWISHYENGGTVLFCLWHQQFLPAIRYFSKYGKYNPSLMISKSRDGEIIANVAEHCGWHAVRGSSSSGGSEALRMMAKRLRKHRIGGHILDGPQGPAGIVKPGVIQMARISRAAMVPVCTSADRAWFVNSWDKFLIPKPFAKVKIVFFDPIEPPSKTERDFEKQRLNLETRMRPCLLGF